MTLFRTILLATQLLAPSICAVHTGFSYGAFWTEQKPKVKADFVRLFNLAKNLPGVPVPFNSARLFQTSQWMKEGEPSEAFEAAIETNTTLLLGMWLSKVDTEMAALDKAFEKHGQKFADLIVGISVGNEDIYRGSPDCTRAGECNDGLKKEQVKDMIAKLRTTTFPQKPWWKLFKTPPPIGHTDIAKEAGLEGLDFVGTTIYPVWNRDPIEKANESFFNSLDMVQRIAGKTPVWITETGWPASGKVEGASEASVPNMQRFWKDVGCSIFGKHNVWWFQLERDTAGESNKFDWGLVDQASRKPQISDLSCPGMPGDGPAPSPSGPPPPPNPPSSTLTTKPSPSAPPPPLSSPPSASASSTKPSTSGPPPPFSPLPPPPSSQAPPTSPSPSTSKPTPPSSATPPPPAYSTAPPISSPSPPAPAPTQTSSTVCTTVTVVVTVLASAPSTPASTPKASPSQCKRRVSRY